MKVESISLLLVAAAAPMTARQLRGDVNVATLPGIQVMYSGYDLLEIDHMFEAGVTGRRARVFETELGQKQVQIGANKFAVPQDMLVTASSICSFNSGTEVIVGETSLSNAIRNSISVTGGAMGGEFTASTAFRNRRESTERSEDVTSFHRMHCLVSQAQRDFAGANVLVTRRLLDELINLFNARKNARETIAQRILTQFGTHVLQRVSLGALYSKEFRTSRSDYTLLHEMGVDIKTGVRASVMGVTAGTNFERSNEQRQQELFHQSSTLVRSIAFGGPPPRREKLGNGFEPLENTQHRWRQEILSSPFQIGAAGDHLFWELPKALTEHVLRESANYHGRSPFTRSGPEDYKGWSEIVAQALQDALTTHCARYFTSRGESPSQCNVNSDPVVEIVPRQTFWDVTVPRASENRGFPFNSTNPACAQSFWTSCGAGPQGCGSDAFASGRTARERRHTGHALCGWAWESRNQCCRFSNNDDTKLVTTAVTKISTRLHHGELRGLRVTHVRGLETIQSDPFGSDDGSVCEITLSEGGRLTSMTIHTSNSPNRVVGLSVRSLSGAVQRCGVTTGSSRTIELSSRNAVLVGFHGRATRFDQVLQLGPILSVPK
jgi:hypothetical protein